MENGGKEHFIIEHDFAFDIGVDNNFAKLRYRMLFGLESYVFICEWIKMFRLLIIKLKPLNVPIALCQLKCKLSLSTHREMAKENKLLQFENLFKDQTSMRMGMENVSPLKNSFQKYLIVFGIGSDLLSQLVSAQIERERPQ